MLIFSLCGNVSCDHRAADRIAAGPDDEIRTLSLAGDAAKKKARYAEALAAYQKALNLADKEKDPKKWSGLAMDVALMRDQLAAWKESEPLCREILRLIEQHFGKEAPETAAPLNKLARLLQNTNRLAEAEPLMRRARDIDEASFGKDHPDVAGEFSILAQLLQKTNRLAEAEPLMRRHLEIFVAFSVATGLRHPHLETAINNYRIILTEIGDTDVQAEEKIAKILESITKKYPSLRAGPARWIEASEGRRPGRE